MPVTNFLRAEARSLELPKTIACDVCEYKGTDREHDCLQCDDEVRDTAMEARFDGREE